MPTKKQSAELLTLPQAQEALGCSRSKIYLLAKENRLRLVKFDHGTRITAASLQALLRKIARTPARVR